MTVVTANRFPIRRYECDAYGHLNNVNYVRFLGEALQDAQAMSVPPWCWQTRALEIEYLRPVRHGDTLELQLSLSVCTEKNARWAGSFSVGGSGTVAARAEVEVCIADRQEEENGETAALQHAAALGRAACAADAAAAVPLAAGFPVAPPPPAGIFVLHRRVTWQDLGPGRRVEEATYLAFIEEAGMGVIEAHGWPAARMADEGFAILLRRHQAEFLQPARLGDSLTIATWASHMQRVSALRHYTITRVPDGALLARVHTLGVWVDLATGRPMRIPPKLAADFAPNIVT